MYDTTVGVIKGDARSLDSSSCSSPRLRNLPLEVCCAELRS